MLAEDLLDSLGEKQADALCLSASLSSHTSKFNETVEKTRARFPQLDILAGGRPFLHNTEDFNSDPHLSYLRSLYELQRWVATL